MLYYIIFNGSQDVVTHSRPTSKLPDPANGISECTWGSHDGYLLKNNTIN